MYKIHFVILRFFRGVRCIIRNDFPSTFKWCTKLPCNISKSRNVFCTFQNFSLFLFTFFPLRSKVWNVQNTSRDSFNLQGDVIRHSTAFLTTILKWYYTPLKNLKITKCILYISRQKIFLYYSNSAFGYVLAG